MSTTVKNCLSGKRENVFSIIFIFTEAVTKAMPVKKMSGQASTPGAHKQTGWAV